MNAPLRLVMIADDLTGSFDTGVQFEKRGASVSFTTPENLDGFSAGTDVVVIDTESRHVPPDAAFQLTARAVRWAVEQGAQHVYIKTDSGLRGNVGPSIKAALQETDCTVAAFAPAYPDMKRVTVHGCQLIDGVPVHESVFGRDPFDPVTSPTVRGLIEPHGVAVKELEPGGDWPQTTADPTTWVIDAETNDDLSLIARRLSGCAALRVTAGCAAFAAALYPVFGLPDAPRQPQALLSPLLAVCGSVNAITRSQVLYGQAIGFRREVIDPFVLTGGAFTSGSFDSLLASVRRGEHLLIDTGLVSSPECVPLREQIASRLGWLMHRLLVELDGQPCTPMIIGGDTLMGFLRLLDQPDVHLEGEAAHGVVIFSVMLKGRRVRLLSKSGGFGEETLLKELCDSMTAIEGGAY